MSEHSIKAYIIGNKQVNGCEVGCGMDWSSAENIALADQQIEVRFGDRVRLKYLDMSEAMTVPGWQRYQKVGNEKLPVLVINGEPRIAGLFDMRMLLDAVEAEVEISI